MRLRPLTRTALPFAATIRPPARRDPNARRWCAPLAMLLLAAGSPAQVEPPEPAEIEPITARDHDEESSWRLFAACDANADDRLDLFEAVRAFPHLEGGKNRRAYRELDVNADGFLQWPEFDARFRRELHSTGKFVVRPTRPVELRTRAVAGDDADPTAQVMRRFDIDASEGLDRDEFLAFLAAAKMSADLVEHFATLDTDKSGFLEESEFRPALQFVPAVWKPKPEVRGADALPPHHRVADANGDGVINLAELELALRRIHPTFSFWARRILREADRNGSRSLGAAELESADRSAREAANIAGERK